MLSARQWTLSRSPNNKKWRTILVIALGFLLSACSQKQAPIQSPQAQMYHERLVLQSQNLSPTYISQRNQALHYYQSIDDRLGQWQAHLGLANGYLAASDRDQALVHARAAHRLALTFNNPSMQYASDLQLGQLSGDRQLIQSALENADTTLKQAVCMALLQQFDGLESLLKELPQQTLDNSKQLGFVFYHWGKHQNDLASLNQALHFYRSAGHASGVVDTLFVSAKIAQQEDPQLAQQFAQRALLAAIQLENDPRQARIKTWIQQNQGNQ